MSKKNIFILLIIGIVLLGIGFAEIFHYTNTIVEKYPDLIIFFDDKLEEGQLSSTPINLLPGEDVIITILSPKNQMYFSLTGPDGSTLEETAFFGSMSHHLEAKTNGTYTIDVGNMDTHTGNMMGLLSAHPISDDEFFTSSAILLATASFFIIIGFVMVIASVVILALKTRSKKNPKNIK